MLNYTEKWHSFSQSEVNAYNKMIKDTNPIHYDEDFCKNTIFQAPIVPGLLTASLFGGLLGSSLPDGAILLGQNLKFILPVYMDERIRAVVEFKEQRDDKPIIIFKTTCYKSDDEVAIDGEAVIRL